MFHAGTLFVRDTYRPLAGAKMLPGSAGEHPVLDDVAIPERQRVHAGLSLATMMSSGPATGSPEKSHAARTTDTTVQRFTASLRR